MNPTTTKGLIGFMLRDLRGSSAMRSLWVFAASLILGITLVSACSGLLQLVRGGFEAQQRQLFGGDLQVSQREPLNGAELQWLNDNATVSRLLELRTMMGTEDGDFTVVELQSVDEAYPLYGNVRLQPEQTLSHAVGQSSEGRWGAAFDPVLAEQFNLETGQLISIGSLQLELRAMIIEQPDRSLRADVRGPPLLIDADALKASGLMLPTSLIDYDYRVKTTAEAPEDLRDRLRAEFPDASWEVQTVNERGDFVSRQLEQVASVLLLIGFSTLFIGGLGVSNSVGAYLQTKFKILATLQSLGSRDRQVAAVYVGQIALLGFFASCAGAVLGMLIAWVAALAISARLPIDASLVHLLIPTLLSVLFGTLTALLFAMPTLGRTLSTSTAQLIKGVANPLQRLPRSYQIAIGLMLVLLTALLLVLIPEPWIGLAFIVTLSIMLALLQLIIIGVRKLARGMSHATWLDGRFALRLASANLSGPGSSLRPMLLSLGTALTLLVASATIIAATVKTLGSAVPQRAPSLVFYDLQEPEREAFTHVASDQPGFEELAVAPLVLGRLTSVNQEALSNSDVAQRALEANDEHKLSYRQPGVDNTTVNRGAWWPENYTGPTLVAMEDREADQLGLEIDDELEFTILGETVQARLAAIYSQARFETSFWLEAVFTPNVLDPFISRNIGSIHLAENTDVQAMSAIAEAFPGVVMIRTAKVLEAARSLLASASLGVLAIAAVSTAASVLVMASVVAVSRQRQVYEASVFHALGTRKSLILRSVVYEYALLAIILTLFATALGSLIAWLILEFWLKLPTEAVWLIGLAVAFLISCACLLAGALWLIRSLALSPASLLRRSAA